MAKESYEELLLQLGDLARERLGSKPNPPATMEDVFAAEDTLLAVREEKEALEQEMNDEDAAYQDFLEAQSAERTEQEEIVKKWRKAVEGVEGRSRELRKTLSSQKAALRYEKISIKRAEAQHKEFELKFSHQPDKVRMSAENLKRARIKVMRKDRDLEEMDRELELILTPKPGQPGAQGILAHKRLLEMEDEGEVRKAEHEERMQTLDETIAAREEEEKDAEAVLDDAVAALGEEVYSLRLPDPALAAFYPRLDKAK